MDPALLQAYVGRYRIEPGFELTFTVEGLTLVSGAQRFTCPRKD